MQVNLRKISEIALAFDEVYSHCINMNMYLFQHHDEKYNG